jgi:hypothetical protein
MRRLQPASPRNVTDAIAMQTKTLTGRPENVTEIDTHTPPRPTHAAVQQKRRPLKLKSHLLQHARGRG